MVSLRYIEREYTMSKTNIDLLVHNTSQIVTPLTNNQMSEIQTIPKGCLAITNGKITDIGSENELQQKYHPQATLDAQNMLICPGFVDSHTHAVFVRSRENEFEMRLQGKTYVDIAKAGGGILSSIQAVRDADESLLYDLAFARLQKMIACGTTTCEVKSGYGLSTESELKMLRVIRRLQETLPIDIVATFMGAHEFPLEYRQNKEGYINLLINEMLPEVKVQNIAEFCDIFTEAHVYDIPQSRKILTTAQKLGFGLKMHADEIEPMGGAELAAELHATSADHLGACSPQGILEMQKAGVIPVLLPGTLFSLRSKTYAPAREMINAGLKVAIATDFNPGSCNIDSMQLIIAIACLQMGLLPAEALTAATLNAAHAVKRQDSVGSLEVGKNADFLLLDIPSIQYIPFHMGSNMVHSIYKKGKKI